MYAHDFLEKYRIPTLVVNEETPKGVQFWKENVWDGHSKKVGLYRHFIVTTEQLFKLKQGHFSRLGLLIRTHQFRRVIARFCIGEAHFIFFAGLPRYSVPAFRPSWGRLNEIKILFPEVPFNIMTATSPPHVLRAIENAVLKNNYQTVNYSCNRPNLIDATHCAVGSLDNIRNFEFILTRPFSLAKQKRVLVFFDRISLLCKVLRHLRSLLPDDLPIDKKRVVRFYDSCMSGKFLAEAHADFTTPDGPCRVLLSTTSESTGIDFPDVDIVVNANIPPTAADAGQRRGRALRQQSRCGLFLILYEEWGSDIAMDEFETTSSTFGNDPDRPRAALNDKSDVKDRAAYSMVQLLNDKTLCIRKFFRDYLKDNSPNTLSYTGPFRCDHHDDGFKLNDFLPSPVFVPVLDQATEDSEDDGESEEKSRNRYRLPVLTRYKLQVKLWHWRQAEHAKDLLRAVRPPEMIISDHQLVDLAKALPSRVGSPELIQMFLGMGNEWAAW
ncbi:hypothetical protein PM082_024011 [Marasmius tenuissimus]|nr:hypothetical protein PM082_024011 [Marasmius tenuissimus]